MRRVAKRFLSTVAAVLVSPALLGYTIGAALLGRTASLQGWSQCLSLIPGLGGSFLRRAFYRFTLQRCGADVHVGFGSTFSRPDAEINNHVYIGNFCSIGLVTIKPGVLVASYVSILSGARQHSVARDDDINHGSARRVTVGENTWIGERAVVMADVGRNCTIGAGAVVTAPIPDDCVAVGVPARVVRKPTQKRSDAECCPAG